MDDFWLILGAPIIVLIVGLVVEYWVIQPIKLLMSSEIYRKEIDVIG